jgi:membrane protein implicated in regulation of membrane protease activity
VFIKCDKRGGFIMSWTISWTLIWLIGAGILTVIEAVTITFFFIWIAIGAVAASLVSYYGGPLWLQMIIFAIVSVVLIIVTKPLAKKLNQNTALKHTKDTLIGKRCIVTKEIDNSKSKGEVKLDGVFWKAKSSQDNIVIKEGNDVYVTRLDRLKLVVTDEKVYNEHEN